MSWGRWLPLLLVAFFSGLFAYFNAGQRVAVGLGFTTIYRVPFVAIVFTAFLLGMVTMFIVGLNHDRRMRRLLQERDAATRERHRLDPSAPTWHRQSTSATPTSDEPTS